MSELRGARAAVLDAAEDSSRQARAEADPRLGAWTRYECMRFKPTGPTRELGH